MHLGRRTLKPTNQLAVGRILGPTIGQNDHAGQGASGGSAKNLIKSGTDPGPPAIRFTQLHRRFGWHAGFIDVRFRAFIQIDDTLAEGGVEFLTRAGKGAHVEPSRERCLYGS